MPTNIYHTSIAAHDKILCSRQLTKKYRKNNNATKYIKD